MNKLADITGTIGQYAHGNEPSHHIAYLYTYGGGNGKPRRRSGILMKEMYHENRWHYRQRGLWANVGLVYFFPPWAFTPFSLLRKNMLSAAPC